MAYKSKPGPFGFHPDELRAALLKAVLSVPAVTEVWYPHPPHSHRPRTGHAFSDPQRGQRKPAGQRSRARYARHASSVAKFASNSIGLRGYSSTTVAY